MSKGESRWTHSPTKRAREARGRQRGQGAGCVSGVSAAVACSPTLGPAGNTGAVSVSYSALRMEQASPLCPPPHFPSDSFTTCPPVLSLPPRPSAPRVGQRSQAFRAVVVQLPNHCRQLFPGPTGSVGMLVASGSHHFAGSLVHFPTAPTVKTHQPHPLG